MTDNNQHVNEQALPPLPEGDEYSATRMLPNGELAPRYTAASMQAYARAAIERRASSAPVDDANDGPTWADVQARERDIRALQSRVIELENYIRQAAPEAPAAASVKTWQLITAPGQVKVGDKLRFTIGDTKYNETVKLVLDAGTDREELLYNRRMNYYVITKNAITGFGSSKNVEFLPKVAQQSTKETPCGS